MMTLKEWVKNELEFWKEAIKNEDRKEMKTYCLARIDAAKGMENFIYLNERDEK